MKTLVSFQKFRLTFLTLLACQGVSLGQSLSDVVLSLSDRQRVFSQGAQVAVYLANQNKNPGDTDQPIPDDNPIDWIGVGKSPVSSSVDGLPISGKIALLNQAVAEFDRLKVQFLNSSDGEFSANSVVGTLQSYAPCDFDPLPRATPENYQELLGLLAQRVRALRLIKWQSAFKQIYREQDVFAFETVEYNDPGDNNPHDGNKEPYVKLWPEGTDPASITWKTNAIGPGGKLFEGNFSQRFQVQSSAHADVSGGGSYSESKSDEVPQPLRNINTNLLMRYPESVKYAATASGAAGTQIGGSVFILRRSDWNQLSVTGAPAYFTEIDQAGYVVVGSGSAGSITLFADPPTAAINGSWALTWTSSGGTSEIFVPDGYQYLKAYYEDGSYDHWNSYEQNWTIGCMFTSVFKPTFTRGVDDPGMRTKLETADSILADNQADGKLLLHPRPELFFGIQLGPGLKGAGSGYISCGSPGYSRGGAQAMPRFDSSYSLQFAGSCSDFHVVYENDRSTRSQSLPTDAIGWPRIGTEGAEYVDTYTLYQAWDSPRLKQVAGRDLVANIEYNSSHYGGYTVKVYRRNTGSSAPTPGQELSISGMTLVRTWTFSHPGANTTAHPTDAEKLEVTGSGGEKYEILANHILSDWEWGYWYFYSYWHYSYWQKMEGAWSWTLKALEGTAEKYREDIGITSIGNDGWPVSDVSVGRFLDGQLVSNLSSMTLDPFSDQSPSDWIITSAGKTITGSATLGAWDDRATGYGKWPVSASINYGDIQPTATYTWDTNGLLATAAQGSWSATGSPSGDTYTLARKFNSSTYATTATQLSDGGNKVKTSTTAAGDTAWSEIEYGSTTSGLPGLPHIVRNSDGSGTTYGWNTGGDGSYTLTLEQGKLSGSSVSGGTKVVSAINAHGHPNNIETFATTGGTLKTAGSAFSNPTPWGMPKTSTDHNTGLTATWDFDNNLSRLSSCTSLLGVASSVTDYDALERPGHVTTNGISAANTYNAFSTTSTISGAASGNLSETRDALGRLTASNTTWNGVTDNLNISLGTSSDVLTRNQSLLGTHQATLRKDDGTAASSSGPTQPFGGNNGTGLTIDNGLFKTTTQLADQSAAYQTTWTDAWGRIHKTETAKGTTELLYSAPTSTLQRVRITDPTGRKTITESDPYNTAGAITRSGIDMDGNGELGSGDRYVESTTKVSGGTVLTTLKLTEDSGLREILRTAWNPAGNQTTTTVNGSEETITRTPNYTTKTVTTTSTKGWEKNETLNNLGLTTNSTLSGTGLPTATLTPTWNPDGTLSAVSFTASGNTHSATFKNDGTLASLTAPGKGNILGVHTIGGGTENLTLDGTTFTRKLDGTQQSTSGPDVIGKTETLAVSGSGFRETTHPALGADTSVDLHASGDPTAKTYAAGAGESYGYQNGLLNTITLARGGAISFDYSNDGAKDLTSATWPQVTSGPFVIPATTHAYGHDRAGRINEIGDDSGVRDIAYQNGCPATTTWNSGPLASYQMVTTCDTQGTNIGFTAKRSGVVIHSAAKATNEPSGEISGVSSGSFTATYGRDTARNIISVTRGPVTQSWTRDTGGRITAATNNVPGAPNFAYTDFDTKGRRLNCTTTGGTWTYQYNGGQLSSATHPTLGNFIYQFDAIGRRTENSANTSDLLNRTLAWTNSQNKTLKITAAPTAQVWFNGTQISNFTGSYNYPVPSPGAQGGWVAWNTLAVLPGQGDAGANPDAKAEQSGATYIPPINEAFSYDAAGNRESSALWNYGWDAKNNLVKSRTKDYNIAPQGYDITNSYDSQNHRFSKKVNRWQNGTITEKKTITFLHDSNNLVYERHQLPSGLTLLERKYVWGPDISGTQGGAGGAGGLLLIRETKGNATIDLYPLYDGSGNVTALADNTGTLQAEYGYSPFGVLLYARGPHADSCPFRFQTKYYDQETGLCMFRKRPYDPPTAQWLSREPLGEKESIDLYRFAGNDPINNVDRDGLESVPMYQNQIAQAAAQSGWAQYEHAMKAAGIEDDFRKWLNLFAAAEASGQKADTKLMDAVAYLRASGQETNNFALETTLAGAGARIDVANAGITRIFRQSSFHEWVSGRDSGSIDPAGDPDYYDDNNPEFQGDEWRRRLIQLSPGGTIARHAVNGQYGAASLEFGKEVAIWSTFSIAGEFVGTGKVAFGVTRGGMGGGASSTLWNSAPPGIQVRQYGNWWVKRVNPNSNALMRWWGKQSINSQYRGLQQLGDMATENSMRNGMIFTRDVGPTLPEGLRLLNPASRRAYIEGSRRMGTLLNDIQPRNMGVNGLIFDPAIDPISKGLFYGGIGVTVGFGTYEILNQ